jgi:hypothetical protein
MKAEQFIQDHTRNCCNEIGYCHNKTRNHNHAFYNWLTPGHARMAVQIAREEVIENICTFLKDRIEHDSIDYPMATMHLINDLKRYVNDKL